jgi:hypothetical protein
MIGSKKRIVHIQENHPIILLKKYNNSINNLLDSMDNYLKDLKMDFILKNEIFISKFTQFIFIIL